jgi:hypothetical protein
VLGRILVLRRLLLSLRGRFVRVDGSRRRSGRRWFGRLVRTEGVLSRSLEVFLLVVVGGREAVV